MMIGASFSMARAMEIRLFLAAGQSTAALANHGVIAIRRTEIKVMAASLLRRLNHLLMGSIRAAKL